MNSPSANGRPKYRWADVGEGKCSRVTGRKEKGRKRGTEDRGCEGETGQRLDPTYNREHERAQNVPQRSPGDGRDRRHHALEPRQPTLTITTATHTFIQKSRRAHSGTLMHIFRTQWYSVEPEHHCGSPITFWLFTASALLLYSASNQVHIFHCINIPQQHTSLVDASEQALKPDPQPSVCFSINTALMLPFSKPPWERSLSQAHPTKTNVLSLNMWSHVMLPSNTDLLGPCKPAQHRSTFKLNYTVRHLTISRKTLSKSPERNHLVYDFMAWIILLTWG